MDMGARPADRARSSPNPRPRATAGSRLRRRLRSADVIQAPQVVPEDLPLRALGQWKLAEGRDRAGIFRIGVRVVGREHEVVVPEPFDVAPDRIFISFYREESVSPEIFRRLPPELRHLVTADPF